MKISKLGAATLIPATAAGVIFTAMPFAEAAPAPVAHRVAHHAVHHAAPTQQVAKPAKAAATAKTHTAAKPAATQSTASSVQTPAQTPAPAPAQTQPATTTQPLTAGMSSFEACVAWHESGDNPTASSAGLFGILPATWAQLGYSGTAGQASVAQQKVAFQRLYSELGTSPWAPYDGC